MSNSNKRICILILGMHRSGTSALTRVLSIAGATLPKNLIGKGKGNESGHWESSRIIEYNDNLLTEFDSCWHDWRTLDLGRVSVKRRNQIKLEIANLISEEYNSSSLLILKDPRICRFASIYMEALNDAGIDTRIVMTVRNPIEVIESLHARNMGQSQHLWTDPPMTRAKASLLWLRHYLDAEYYSRDKIRAITSFDSLFASWQTMLKEVSTSLGIVWPKKETEISRQINQFLKPDLKHNTSTTEDVTLNEHLRGWVDEVYSALVTLSDCPSSSSALKTLDNVRHELSRSAPMMQHLLGENTTAITSILLNESQNKIEAHELASQEAREAHQAELEVKQDELKQADLQIEAHELASQEAREAHQAELEVKQDELKQADLQIEAHELASQEAREAHQAELEVKQDELKQADLQIEAHELASQEAREAHQAELNKLDVRFRQSTSWKITAPLRKVVRIKNSIIHIGKEQKNDASSKFINTAAAGRHLTLFSDWHIGFNEARNEAASNKWPSITISAVVLNSAKWLPSFLKSLRSETYPKNKINLSFVDHGSTDGTIKLLKDFKRSFADEYSSIAISNRHNDGYGAGNDFSIRNSHDDFVLVTNVDIEYHGETLTKAIAAALTDSPKVASWELRQCPFEHPKYYDPVTLETSWNSHACVLFRRSAYLQVGGYEKRIFMYGEDVELSYRFRGGGWILRYLPFATVTHHVNLHDTTFRPTQLSGSLAANTLLRYRYGSTAEIAIGERQLRQLNKNEIDATRAKSISAALGKVRKERFNFFVFKRPSTNASFPFSGFDYHISRDGFDVELTPLLNSTDAPLVSIITRTHGESIKYLSEAISSVLNQTYPNIEHLIVEDRTDAATDLVERVAQCYNSKIEYIKSDGTGRSRAGNCALAQANGRYLMFLDNDDLLYPEHVELLVSSLLNNKNCQAAYSLAWDVKTKINDKDMTYTEMTHTIPDNHRLPYCQDRLQELNFIPIQALLFRRELYENYGGFHEDMDYLEDWNLWTRYSQAGPFIHIPKMTSLYRTPWNSTASVTRQKLLDNAYKTARARNESDRL